ncbi:MAG: VOC family protein [Lewinellaceae bacterium]|nr:VOC family protein [Lewinella sp.]MCB9280186.1 VOC family protein [Lewinellaceae bacterium]
MSSAFLGLRTAIYRVPDIEKAKAWYSEVFGVQPYFDQPFYVGFEIGGFELGLQPLEGNTEGPKSDSVLTYWGVEHVRTVYDRLLDLGATPHEEPVNVGGPIEVASVKDPWDNIIGIIYNPEFKIK